MKRTRALLYARTDRPPVGWPSHTDSDDIWSIRRPNRIAEISGTVARIEKRI